MRGTLLILLAAVLFGTTGTTQAFAPPGATPLAVGTVRLLVGGLALVLVARSRGAAMRVQHWPRRVTLMCMATVAAYQVCFFAGVANTGVAVGTVIALGSAPVFGGLLGRLVRGEMLTGRWYAATALAVAGCALLVLAGNDLGLRLNPVGVLLALGAGLAYALYTLGSKRLLDDYPSLAVMAVAFGGGALLLLPLLAFVPLAWLWTPGGLLVALHLGLLTTALAYILFGAGLRTVSIATATTLTLAEPLTAGLLGVWVLGERLQPLAWTGIGLLAVGLALLTLRRRR